MAKIEHQTLNDRAYAELKKGLTSGRFRPGEVLIIRQLADRYGISATPVREALQRLVAERALEMLPNRSIAVPILTREKFAELRRIRCALEGLAAELAAPSLSAADIGRMTVLIEAMDKDIAKNNAGDYLDRNERFHFLIYSRAGSPILLRMIADLWTQVGPFLNFLFEDSDYLPEANNGHKEILRAVEKGDAAALSKSVISDIVSAAKSLAPRLDELVGVDGVAALRAGNPAAKRRSGQRRR
jgi:DNA-binding GntR family transcriptional regulator